MKIEDSSEGSDICIDMIQVNEMKLSLLADFDTKMNTEKELLEKSIDEATKRMSKRVDKLISTSRMSAFELLGLVQEKKAKPIFSEKVFQQRESLLTESSRTGKEAHTVFNVFVAILLLIFLKMIVHDVFMKGHGFIDVSLLHDVSSEIKVGYVYWIYNFLFSFSIVFLAKAVVSLKLNPSLYFPLYLCIQSINLVYPIYIALTINGSPVSGIVLTCEMARFAMKIHGYFREKMLHCTPNKYKEFIPKFAQKRGIKYEDLNMPNINMGGLFTELRRFNYYLWVPTIIYRDDYVMRPKISMGNLLSNLLTFNLCFYYTFALIKGFVSPTFNNYFQEKADIEDIVAISTATGIIFLLMAFFGVLHSWMNIFSELTRFGDRQFYTDWWNVSNYGAYYRKWNIIVHEWLYYYVYNDSVRFTEGRINSAVSKFLVFFISAIIHEVIVACTLKFFFPILLILFGGPGVIFMTMTRSNNRILGIGFWFTMIIGNGLLIVLYGMEYYTRQQPEYIERMEIQGPISFFIPQCYHYLSKRYS